MSIPSEPSLAWISTIIFLLGLFLFISGLNIIKIERLYVNHGFKTWFIGLLLIIASALILIPKIKNYYASGFINKDKNLIPKIPNILNSGFERNKKYWIFEKHLEDKDYKKGIDSSVSHTGKNSAYIEAVVDKPNRSTTILRFHPNVERLRENRIKITSFIKTKNVEEAGIWARVDLDNGGHILDNMMDRAIYGTNKWKQYSIVLDVPKNSTSVVFGAIFNGKGKAWYDDFKFEIVDKSISTTEVDTKNYIRKDMQVKHSDKGYILYFDGKIVGHEPSWTLQKATENLQWNKNKYKTKNVSGQYNGQPM